MDGDEAARVPLVVERVLALEPVHVLVVLLGYGRGAPLLGRAVVVEGAAGVGREPEERDAPAQQLGLGLGLGLG